MQAQVHTSVFQRVLSKLSGLLAFLNGRALVMGARICIMQLMCGYDERSLLKVWWVDVRGFFPLFISGKGNIMKSLHIIIFMAVKLNESKSHCANDISSNM